MQKDIGDDGLDPWRRSLVVLAEALLSTSVSIIRLPIRIYNGDLSRASSPFLGVLWMEQCIRGKGVARCNNGLHSNTSKQIAPKTRREAA